MNIPMEPFTVALVVDREFGARLDRLEVFDHVWLIQSPTNELADVEFERRAGVGSNKKFGPDISTFYAGDDESPAVTCARLVEELDSHHSGYAGDPAWSEIRVFGASLDVELESRFRVIGAQFFSAANHGFVVSRRLAALGAGL